MIVPVTDLHIPQKLTDNYNSADQSPIMKHYYDDYMATYRYKHSPTSQYYFLWVQTQDTEDEDMDITRL